MAKTLTEVEFENIKLLLSAGVKVAQISKVSGRSNFAVGNVKKATSYKEYRAQTKKRNSTRTQPFTEPAQEDASESTRIVEVLENLDKRLEAIEISVKWIENHTEAKPRKKHFSFT